MNAFVLLEMSQYCLYSRNAEDYESVFHLYSFRLRHHLFLTFYGAKDHSFYWHKLLANETLATTGTQKTLCCRVPVEVVVADALNFWVNRVVTTLADLVSKARKTNGFIFRCRREQNAPAFDGGRCCSHSATYFNNPIGRSVYSG